MSEEETDVGDIQGIESLLEALESCVMNANSGSISSLFSDDVRMFFAGDSTLVRGKNSVSETWKRHMDQWSEVRIIRRNTAMRVHGDVAWGSFVWDGEGVSNGNHYRLTGERWTVVLIWTEEGWRFSQAHTSMPYKDWESHRTDG